MRHQIYVLLISSLFVWPTSDSFAQTDGVFFSRDEIPAANAGTVDAFYDPFTGEVLVSVGEQVALLFFGVSSTIESDEAIERLEASFDAIDRDAVREDAIDSLFFDESPAGLGWLDLSALPTGIFNLGAVYDVLPIQGQLVPDSPLLTVDPLGPRGLLAVLAERSIEEQLAFESAAQDYFRDSTTGLSLAFQAFGEPAQEVPIRFLRPELAVAIPEPCSAILLPVAGAGLLMRRRRA